MSPGDIHQRLGTSVVVITGGRSYWRGVGGDAARRPSAQTAPHRAQPPRLAPALGGARGLWVPGSAAAPPLAATLSPPSAGLCSCAEQRGPGAPRWAGSGPGPRNEAPGGGIRRQPQSPVPLTHGPAPPGSGEGGHWQDTERGDPAWAAARPAWGTQSGL